MLLSDANQRIISRAAREIRPGMVVNLGIGLPTKVVDHLNAEAEICLHSENGLAGMGPTVSLDAADRNLIDAGGAYVSTIPGAAFLDSATSFAIVRSGRLDLTMLGAFEVAQNGDLANWKIPGKFSPGVGGGVELAQKAKSVVILTTHKDRRGNSKLKETCSLPITAPKCVSRIVTDMAVIDVTQHGFVLVEIAHGFTVQDVIDATDAKLVLPHDAPPVF